MREIPTAEKLTAQVEGDIAEVDEVLRITSIRIKYDIPIPAGAREKVARALETYAEKCPAYQSVKGCIDVAWDAEIHEC